MDLKVVGKPVARKDAIEKVTGQTKFGADIDLTRSAIWGSLPQYISTCHDQECKYGDGFKVTRSPCRNYWKRLY